MNCFQTEGHTAGDEQLLSVYLTKLNDKGEHDFVFNSYKESYEGIFLDESFWEGMKKNSKYIEKKQAERESYAWDRLIEHVIKHTPSQSHPVVIEPAVRLMASEPRIRRRQLARAIVKYLLRVRRLEIGQFVWCIPMTILAERTYFSSFQNSTASHIRNSVKTAKIFLGAYCRVAKLNCVKAEFIIGIATEPHAGAGSSEDIAFFDVRNWTIEMETEARQLQEKYSLLKASNLLRTDTWEDEFPGRV